MAREPSWIHRIDLTLGVRDACRLGSRPRSGNDGPLGDFLTSLDATCRHLTARSWTIQDRLPHHVCHEQHESLGAREGCRGVAHARR